MGSTLPLRLPCSCSCASGMVTCFGSTFRLLCSLPPCCLILQPRSTPPAGAFAIAQQRGKQDAFIRTLATESLIVSKCAMEHPQEVQVEGQAPSKVAKSTAHALAAAIKEMRAKARPAVIKAVASHIELDCRDADLDYLQLTLQKAFGWGVAHHAAVAGSIARAYTQVRAEHVAECGADCLRLLASRECA
jgi:hypothetical protein